MLLNQKKWKMIRVNLSLWVNGKNGYKSILGEQNSDELDSDLEEDDSDFDVANPEDTEN